MTDVKYWIWLQNVLGIGEKTFDIINEFGDPKTVYETEPEILKKSGLFKRTQLERKKNIPLDVSDKPIADCKRNGWHIVTPDSEFYPELLKNVADFPLVLYVWGDVTALKSQMPIGVIGTRRPSQYGTDVAYTLTKELSKNGALIVSGGAQGIDSTAHTTAMEEGNKTLLVMGCGLGVNYLMENDGMRRRVAQNGAVISEFAPYTPVTRVSFIQRNRITAGICKGVLVIEAGKKSGTLSTARRSFYYNRDVFVVTGDAKGTNFLGAQELVGCGAKVIFSANDILSLYGCEIRNKESFYFGTFGKAMFEGIDEFPQGRKDEKSKPEKAESDKKTHKTENNTDAKPKSEYDLSAFSETERKVFSAIKSGVCYIDDIARELQLQIRDVLVTLTTLEMEGVVECGAGNEYTLI